MQHLVKQLRFSYSSKFYFIQFILKDKTTREMKHQITKGDLVRDIYGEANYLEKMAIQQAKHSDEDVKEEYDTLKKAQDLLDTVDIQPPNFVIQNILNYSKSSEFEAEAG